MSASDVTTKLIVHGAGYFATVAAGREPGPIGPFLASLIEDAIRSVAHLSASNVGDAKAAGAPMVNRPGSTASNGLGVMRTRIAALLAQRPEGYRASELQGELGISGPTLYQHMKAMNGFVKKSGFQFAAVNPEKIVNDVVVMVNAHAAAVAAKRAEVNSARTGEARPSRPKKPGRVQKIIDFVAKQHETDLTTGELAKVGGFPPSDESGQISMVCQQLVKTGVLKKIKRGVYRQAHAGARASA